MSGSLEEERLQTQLSYWATQDSTVDGMLGGFGSLSPTDVTASLAFLDRLVSAAARPARCALDVGAGIGRVTKHMLIPAGFARVDLLEANQAFLDAAETYVAHPNLGTRFCAPMSLFDFGARKWDMIWIQWVAIYLHDEEFVAFFHKCGQALVKDPASFVVLKENVLKGNAAPVPDTSDASVTRSEAHLKRLWKRAGLVVVEEVLQEGFPHGL